MAQEERKRSSDSCRGGARGSGLGGVRGGRGTWRAGRSSKKQKEKKPPQRGQSIEELERTLFEEQQRKDAASFYPYPRTFTYFCPSESLPNFRVEREFNQSGSYFRHTPSVPNMYLAATSPVPSPRTRNYSHYDAEMRRRRRVTDHELDLGSKMHMPLDSNLAMGGQGDGSDQPPPLVNASSSLSASMPLQSHPLEPPSNQSHNHGSFASQGEKMPDGGAKRSYPFSSENPPAPHFPYKIHKVGNPIMNRPEVPSYFSRSDNLREDPSQSSSMLESNSTDSVKEKEISGGEYLTLAPPIGSPPLQNWSHNQHFEKEISGGEYLTLAPPIGSPPLQNWSHNQHFAYSISRSYNPYPSFEFPQYQGYPEGLVYRQEAPGWTDQRPFQQPYYSFLSPTIPPNNVENPHTNEGSKENTTESIDLNLKL